MGDVNHTPTAEARSGGTANKLVETPEDPRRKQALDALEQEWQAERASLMNRDSGRPRRPTRGGWKIGVGISAGLLLVFVLVVAGGTYSTEKFDWGSLPPMLGMWGIMAAFFVGKGLWEDSKAGAYDAAEKEYQKRRAQILAQFDSQ